MTEEKKDTWVIAGRVVFTIALVLAILFVFRNSMQIGASSSSASQTVHAQIQDFSEKVGVGNFAAQITEHQVRKLAHIFEYALVGFWMMLCLRVYTKRFLRHITWPMFGGLFIGLVDETIQLFSDGRSSSVMDIWIDFFGVMLGLSVAFFLLCLWRMFWILYRNRDQ